MKNVVLSEKLNMRSNNVDVIRFFAALLVIFCHSFYVAEAQEDPLSVFSNGQVNFGGIAVAVFFFFLVVCMLRNRCSLPVGILEFI